MKKINLAIAAAAVLATSSVASDLNIQGLELTPTISYAIPEGNLDLRNQVGVGARLGYTYEHIGAELGYEYFKAKYDDATRTKTNVDRVFINALLPFAIPNSKFDAYLLAGVGYENFGIQAYDNHDGGFFHYGAGLKYKIDKDFGLRFELRDQIKFRHTDHHLIGSFGLIWHWGKEAPAPVAPIVPVVAKPEPAPAPAPKPHRCYDLDQVNVYFDFDKANIKDQYLAEIATLAQHINEEPAYYAYVRGYTDSIGTSKYNQKLSERRAEAAKAALVKAGVAADRVNPSWYGFENPIADNHTKAGRAKNRRVELKIVCQ